MSMFQTLKPKPKSTEGTCLLLDVSGSMDARVAVEEGDGFEPRRIELLFRAVRETPECTGLKAFTFSTNCRPIEVIPSEEEALNYHTQGGTNMADAFITVKAAGFYNAILVTDGEPDSEASALAAAYGMKLGIIYIGNPPVPEFLKRLAAATDGTFQLADMRSDDQLKIALTAALPPPSNDSNSGGGAISL